MSDLVSNLRNRLLNQYDPDYYFYNLQLRYGRLYKMERAQRSINPPRRITSAIEELVTKRIPTSKIMRLIQLRWPGSNHRSLEAQLINYRLRTGRL